LEGGETIWDAAHARPGGSPAPRRGGGDHRPGRGCGAGSRAGHRHDR